MSLAPRWVTAPNEANVCLLAILSSIPSLTPMDPVRFPDISDWRHMPVPTSYMQSTKHLANILAELQQAQVPPKFTIEFLRTLGFTSSNDRSILGVLKSLGFLDDTGAPTERYRRYRNKSEAPYVLADAMREAYSDIFLARENAQSLPNDRIKGILATKVDKGDAVLDKMAATFRVLAGLAKWDRPGQAPVELTKGTTDAGDTSAAAGDSSLAAPEYPQPEAPRGEDRRVPQFAYNIQIQLPATKDISVYNAIFKSIREHLL
jgi:hypothetical protein